MANSVTGETSGTWGQDGWGGYDSSKGGSAADQKAAWALGQIARTYGGGMGGASGANGGNYGGGANEG